MSYRIVVSPALSHYDQFGWCREVYQCFNVSTANVHIFVSRYNASYVDALKRGLRATTWYQSHESDISRILAYVQDPQAASRNSVIVTGVYWTAPYSSSSVPYHLLNHPLSPL